MAFDVNLNVRLVTDPAGRTGFAFGPVETRPAPERSPRMAFALFDDQTTTLHAHAVNDVHDTIDNDKFAAPPTWTVDRPDIVTITPAPDGASCRLDTQSGKLGDAIVTLTAEGKQDTFPVTVTANPAMSGINITADPPSTRSDVTPTPTPAP